MNIFFISDTHFRHANMLNFIAHDGHPIRSFGSVWEMDECMIERWNQVVKPSDHIYHLGDVAMMRPRYIRHTLERLNGHKRLVRGNHDIYKTKEYLEFFDEIYGIRVLDRMLFTHIPVHPLSIGRFHANVHGHIHRNPDYPPVIRTDAVTQEVRCQPYINISVEVMDYRPISLEDLKKKIAVATR
jgi:calcineurin-like phosphoesterase family protein